MISSSVRTAILRGAGAGALALVVGLAACKDATTGPAGTGSIEGRVLSDSTGDPVGGAQVTTSPATSAITSSSDGTFAFRDIEAQEYSITVRKSGFQTRTVSVAVKEDETTSATILLVPEDETGTAQVDTRITSVRNDRASQDSVFTEVEFLVENVSDTTVVEWEVIFDIFVPGDVLKQEEAGQDLQPDEQDVGNFRRFVGADPADSVVIADVFTRLAEN